MGTVIDRASSQTCWLLALLCAEAIGLLVGGDRPQYGWLQGPRDGVSWWVEPFHHWLPCLGGVGWGLRAGVNWLVGR